MTDATALYVPVGRRSALSAASLSRRSALSAASRDSSRPSPKTHRSMGLRAQLFQRIPPLLALFCAAALVSIGMGFYYRKATWKRHRPAAVHVGPELVTCETVRKRRFYLYDMAVSNRCKRSAALLDAVLQAPMERQQMMGPELFLRQQLEDQNA